MLRHCRPLLSSTARWSVQRSSAINVRWLSERTLERDVSVQGVQGSDTDEPRFKLWLDNCQKWGLGDCERKAHEFRSGKKSLEELFKEQEEILKAVAENSDIQPQDMVGLVSPQGIQGDDCERYELWLRNCQQFGFGECGRQLHDVQAGRKTLSQIFMEQDEIIRQAAHRWQSKRHMSTSSGHSTSSGSGVSGADTGAVSGVELSQRERLKLAVKDYGVTVIVFHVAISLMSLGGFYALVSSGVDVVAFLRTLNVGETILQSRLAAGASTFVVAYAVHKVFAPVRIGITLTCVPFIVRYLRRINVLKGAVK